MGFNTNVTDRLPSRQSLNLVEVFTADQLPNTLVTGTHYLLMTAITITATNEITIPNAGNIFISSTDRTNHTLTYSGTTGTLFTSAAMTGSLVFEDIKFIGNGNTSRFCNLVAADFPGLTMDQCNFNGWGVVSILDGFGGGVAIGKIGGSGNAAGIFSVIDSVFFGVENCFFQNFSDTSSNFFTIDSLTARVAMTLTGVVCQPGENVFLINSSFTGELIINTEFATPAGQLFDAAGLDGTSIYVDVSNASNQPDSAVGADTTLTGNTAETSIPLAGALVEINNNQNWIDDSERMTVATDGAVTLDALSPVRLIASGNINMEPANASKSMSIRTVLIGSSPVTVTFTNGTNLINETATALIDGDLISFRDTAGTLPVELRTDIVYYIVSQITNSFQVSYTSGGAAIAFTDDGTPTNSYKTATLHGSTPTNTIAAGSPRDLIPQSTITMTTSSKAFLVITNNSDAVNITVNSGYQRYFG